jgi:hypothetical protein
VVAAWLQAVPALAEGIGKVAAFEALSTALALLEQPSEYTPVATVREDGGVAAKAEVLMLWVSEGVHEGRLLLEDPAKAAVPSQVRSSISSSRHESCTRGQLALFNAVVL